MARIVLNPFGSFGDLHPFMALALELQLRGHLPVVATSEIYAQKIQGAGLGFAPVRPDLGEMSKDQDLIRKVWHPRNGAEFLLRDLLLPAVEASFEDVKKAACRSDLVITHGAAGSRGPGFAVALGGAAAFGLLVGVRSAGIRSGSTITIS